MKNWKAATQPGHTGNICVYEDGKEGERVLLVCSVEYSTREETRERANLIAVAPELLEYAELEEARTLPNDEAATILKAHGWDHSEMSAIEFMDTKRRIAIAKAKGE